jgi:DNA-binding transcriptional LysR family regulator
LTADSYVLVVGRDHPLAEARAVQSLEVLGDIDLVGLGNLIPDRRIGLVWHRDRRQTPAAQAFHRLARECAVGDR